jgi:hypothetical protein
MSARAWADAQRNEALLEDESLSDLLSAWLRAFIAHMAAKKEWR